MSTRAIAAAGLLVLGCLAAPAPASAAEERDCYTSGDYICPPASAAEQMVAWGFFDPGTLTSDELSKPMRVTYMGTTRQWEKLADGHEWFVTPNDDGQAVVTYYVFELEFGVEGE